MQIPEELIVLVEEYVAIKKQADVLKKTVDQMNTRIKLEMKELGLSKVQTEAGTASLSISERNSFNQAKLLDKVKELHLDEAVKTTEYVDMEVLENAIYEGRIDPVELAPCQETTTVETLRISGKKGK